MRRLRHRAEVTAVVDSDLALAGVLAAEFDIPAAARSLPEVLASQRFDGVVITTPTFTHRDLALTALQARLPAHLEKPMAMNLVECGEINDAIAQTGLPVQLGFMRRFDRSFQAAAELLKSGEIGAPMIIKSLTHGPGLPPPWANDIATSNGLIAEVCSHDLDTIGWFADSAPAEIGVKVANFKGTDRGVTAPHFYDTMVATVTFEAGTIASVAGVCPADYGYDSRVEVTATKGMLQVGDTGPGGLTVVHANGVKAQDVYPSWRTRFAEAYVSEMAAFLDVLDGAPVTVGTVEGTQAVALVVAGVNSLLSGRSVALSEVTGRPEVPAWQKKGGLT
jgi:myo-inositol 2-dehydrogenase/D-chiro-inositol 1-dehydrogenase/scyllo-inositol 2-dehydrogenase (NAD+)